MKTKRTILRSFLNKIDTNNLISAKDSAKRNLEELINLEKK